MPTSRRRESLEPKAGTWRTKRACVCQLRNRFSLTHIRSSIKVRTHVRADRPGEPLEPDRGEPPPATAGSDWPGALLLCSHHQCAYPWRALADLTGGGHV